MKIIIAGAGAVGTHLAKLLSRERHDITLMDENPEKLEDISANYDILTVAANPSSISALREAEVGKADLFIGVTPDEAHNMTSCMLASKLGASTMPNTPCRSIASFSRRWASTPLFIQKCWPRRRFCTISTAVGCASGGKCRVVRSCCLASRYVKARKSSIFRSSNFAVPTCPIILWR